MIFIFTQIHFQQLYDFMAINATKGNILRLLIYIFMKMIEISE